MHFMEENQNINEPSISQSNNRAKRIGDILIENGMISKDQLEIALREQRTDKSKDKLIGNILVELGFITESALSQVLSETSGVKNVNLKTTVIDPNLINQLPQEVALRCKVLPIAQTETEVQVATADIYNIMVLDQIKKYFPKVFKITPVYAPESEILEVIDQCYKYEMSIDGILKEIESGMAESKQTSYTGDDYVNPTVRLVDALLIDGIKQGSSDIHFEPEESFVRIRYRIDGKLRQIRSFHKEYWAAIVVRIKIIAKMNIAETRHPQDGRITYSVLGRDIDFRVATQPTIHGENIVMRILDSKQSLVPLDKLGYSDHNLNVIKKSLLRPEGIIVVTGPTGSGKTTTLYSILSHINSIEKNIMTLEDPVEYKLSLIRQSNIREGSGLTFTDGIKSLMRQDPDVIFVGEVRDNETATMAIRAAMTGHQVYSTLHTNDAIGAISRLRDIGVDNSMISGSIICVVAQRLARLLCNKCKEEYTASEHDCKILGVDFKSAPKIFKKIGCESCGFKGYKGRASISEVLQIDRGLDELIATNSTRKTMLEYAMSKGFVPMIDDGTQKVLMGMIDIDSLVNTIDITSRL